MDDVMETVRSLDKIGKHSTLAITEVSLTEGGVDLASPSEASVDQPQKKQHTD